MNPHWRIMLQGSCKPQLTHKANPNPINSDRYSNSDSREKIFGNLFFEPVWHGKLFQMKVWVAAIDSVKFSSKSELLSILAIFRPFEFFRAVWISRPGHMHGMPSANFSSAAHFGEIASFHGIQQRCFLQESFVYVGCGAGKTNLSASELILPNWHVVCAMRSKAGHCTSCAHPCAPQDMVM